MDFLSRGGKDRSARTNPQKKNPRKKIPKEEVVWVEVPSSHSEPRSSYVLDLGLRLRPVMTRRACGGGARQAREMLVPPPAWY